MKTNVVRHLFNFNLRKLKRVDRALTPLRWPRVTARTMRSSRSFSSIISLLSRSLVLWSVARMRFSTTAGFVFAGSRCLQRRVSGVRAGRFLRAVFRLQLERVPINLPRPPWGGPSFRVVISPGKRVGPGYRGSVVISTLIRFFSFFFGTRGRDRRALVNGIELIFQGGGSGRWPPHSWVSRRKKFVELLF